MGYDSYGYTFLHILKSMAVSVQPSDFLGLEIPRTDENSGIYFTSGGPENYVFTGALNSSVEHANNFNSEVVRQRPQIAFNLTSGYRSFYIYLD